MGMIMSTLNSHTHYQVAQANVQTKAWQRVCLSLRTTKPTIKLTEKQESRCPNSVYVAIAGEVVNRRSVLLRNFVLNGHESASNPLQLLYLSVGCKCREPRNTEQ
ncbi:hypothetical protein SAMN05421761_11828 [Belliella pelovolcani]|uniref:Uncharacterized protein n=1 Tax=Belliella pelovolcani TaxID=529505 RepID=A0A1N7PN57_9BACT|nr:hypothetical protein SAMN05421761_11828 [Belliella pelovolcani]